MRLLTCLVVFWTAVQLCASPRRGLALVKAVAAIGIAYACYGLAAALWTPDRVLWADKAASGVVTSTFLSPDAYAAYAGLGLLALVGLALRPERRVARPDSRRAGGAIGEPDAAAHGGGAGRSPAPRACCWPPLWS